MSKMYKVFISLFSNHVTQLDTSVKNLQNKLDQQEITFKEWLHMSLEKIERYEKLTKDEKKTAVRPNIVMMPDDFNANERFDFMRRVYVKNRMLTEVAELDEAHKYMELASSLMDQIKLFGNVSVCDTELVLLQKYFK